MLAQMTLDSIQLCLHAYVQVYNLKHPSQAFSQDFSALRFQTRCVACFPDGKGYAQGSVEGRVACQWLEKGPQSSFTFKCHRWVPATPAS